MNRGMLLVQLARNKIELVSHEAKMERIKSDVEIEPEKSLSIVSESVNEQKDDFKEERRKTLSTFQDFESSGSEYFPSSSRRSSDSELSQIIPQFDNIKMVEEPSSSKVLRYLQNFGNTQNILPKEYKQEDKQLSAKVPDSNITITAEASPLPSPSVTTNNYRQYTKTARERLTICPICYQDVATHFTRHLFRHHENNREVVLIKSLKPGSKDRLALVAALRKQGYFYLKTERNISNPVKTSKDPNTEYFVCTYCLGDYTKKTLSKHVKNCQNKPPDELKATKNCLTKSQTFMASVISKNHEFLKTSRIKKEVFAIMRPDNISSVAKNDPLICLYGESLLNKHKRQQMSIVISNKIREMGRLLLALKAIHFEICGLFDTLRPDMFSSLISATKIISGYDENTKSFKSPSLALHMGTNLKIVCDVAFKVVIEKRNLPNIKWNDRDQKKSEIKDLKKLIEGHWCSELSSLALKTLKERKWEKPIQLPLTSDIQLFQTYVNNVADDAYIKLNNNLDILTSYRKLAECVLALTVMFNRKRVGEVQYLKVDTYNKDTSTVNQEAFIESLTPIEKMLSKKFKRVVAGGKGSNPVPILFPKRIQNFIATLLKTRSDSNIVSISNPYIFANPGSENTSMRGVNIIRKLARLSGAKNPSLLTSTKFRKHIATTLQLMNMEEDEMEQIATFMGHTKKTHAEFYRLPQDIYQTAKVAKVLILLEKGKGKEFRGKSLNEIEMENDVYYSESDSEQNVDDQKPLSLKVLDRIAREHDLLATNTANEASDQRPAKKKKVSGNTETFISQSNLEEFQCDQEQFSGQEEPDKKKKVSGDKHAGKKINGRVRWSDVEKKIVLNHFRQHVVKRVAPKKHECEELIAKHKEVLSNKDWVRVKTLVYNTFRDK